MWNISRPNGGVHSRQFSTMPGPPLLNKTLPGPVNFLSGLCTSFDCMHKISTQKRFVNPNFVNEQNPNVHGYGTAANNLVEKCSSVFLASGTQNNSPRCPKQETPDVQKQSETLMECEEEAKENTKRKKVTNRKTKKRHSLSSSPRKGGNKGKAKSTFNLKCEVDEIGLDPLSDSYDSDLCSSPLNPAPVMDGNIPCFDFGYSISIAAIPESKPKSTVVISINKPKIGGGGGCRSRIPSDCGSEDSFIVFQCSPDDVSDVSEAEEEDDEEMDTGTESDDEDDSDDSSCSESNFVFKTEDVVDFGGSQAAPRKRVRFADDLFVVHPMHCWSFAYREARKGPWETYALDRGRFKDRVQEAEGVLGPVLEPAHRRKIFDERFARTEDYNSL